MGRTKMRALRRHHGKSNWIYARYPMKIITGRAVKIDKPAQWRTAVQQDATHSENDVLPEQKNETETQVSVSKNQIELFIGRAKMSM
jgi:hypothetical protein